MLKIPSLAELAREALAVQDACNLSGVIHGFGRAIMDLRACLPNAGTDEINTHPVCVLWSDKIASLTGSVFGSTFASAYGTCQHLALALEVPHA